ncbi:hypothetical protein [Stenotrophomonas sp.]|uniref:hypothetical protein n=1 Tax=Stenotrophomonas sp. TaxID=69392 RepID=UPI0028AF15B4|nr:hypothetical protein [Stenotrophomonas sp.]
MDPAPTRTFSGILRGFAGGLGGGSPLQPGSAEFQFDPDGGTVTARIAPRTWEGAAFTGSGDYLHDLSYGVTTGEGDAQVVGDSNALCDCDYLSWGQWSADVAANGTTYSAQDGYWIIGQLTPLAELPTDVIASYAGTAIGSVSDNGVVTTGVTGDFTATVDFGSGTGSLQIANFDGRSFGDNALNLDQLMSGMPDGAFSGSLGMDANSGFYGEYSAGFASDGTDPAAAMLGTFWGSDGSWSASGVFAGDKTGDAPPNGL